MTPNLAAVCLATVCLAAACTSGSSNGSPTTTEPATTTTKAARGDQDGHLTIGVLLPNTGPAAALTPPLLVAIDLAVARINEVGGVNGQPVSVVREDEGADTASAAVALDKLVNEEHVDAIIGPASSRVALTIIDRINKAGIVTCSPLNTAIALSDFPDNRFYLRTMPSDALQGVAIGQAISETGQRSAAVIYPDDDYGRRVSVEIANELDRRRIALTDSVSYDPNAADLSGVVKRALAADPRAVAVVGLPDAGAKLLAQLQKQSAFPSRIATVVTDGMRVSDLADRISPGHIDGADGIQGVAPSAVPDDASTWFKDAFTTYAAANGLSSTISYAPYAYDCASLIALAAQSAHSNDPGRFRDELVGVSRNGTICHDFVDCKKSLDAGLDIDLDGASGTVELRANGDVAGGSYDIFVFNKTGRDSTLRQIKVSLP